MYGPRGYLAKPTISPVHRAGNGSAVCIWINGTAGGALFTAKHVNIQVGDYLNAGTSGIQIHITAKYIHPDYDVAVLFTDTDLSGSVAATVADAPPDISGTIKYRMAGWGLTASGMGGGLVPNSSEERWGEGYSEEPNVPANTKVLNWRLSFIDEDFAVWALSGDSGGGIFDRYTLTYYGHILGPGGPPQFGQQPGGANVVTFRHWLATLLADPTKPFITDLKYDLVNNKIRVYFSEAIWWLKSGLAGAIMLTIAGQVWQTTSASPLTSSSGVTFIDLPIASTASRSTGGSTTETWDIAVDSFENGAGNKNVASTNTAARALASTPEDMTPMAPIIEELHVNLGHNSEGTPTLNGTCAARFKTDQALAVAGGSVFSYLYEPLGFMVDLSTGIVAVETTDLPDDTAVMDAVHTIVQNGTPNTSLLRVNTVRDATDTQGNDETEDVVVRYTAGTPLSFTNGSTTVGSGSLAENRAQWRELLAPDNTQLLLSNATGASIVTNGNLRLYVFDADTNAEVGRTTTATPTLTVNLTAGKRYIFGRGNTHSSNRTTGILTVSLPVGTPTANNASAPVGGFSTPIYLQRAATDGSTVDHFKIVGLTNGDLWLADGATQVENNEYVPYADAQGLLFKSSGSSNGSIEFRACRGAADTQISAGSGTATITVSTASTGLSIPLIVAAVLSRR